MIAALLAAIVIAIAVLAWKAPAIALAAAVLLFEFEGSVKILLGLDGVHLPVGSRAAGAAALDVALLAGVAGVLAHDRLRAPRELWSAATREERVVIGLLAGWLALSVIQIAQGGDVARGVHGFRLFQCYTVMVLAGLTIASNRWAGTSVARAALWIALAASLYAAVRVLIGPADAEREFAIAVPTVTTYGGTFRAVGSFSSAVGLSSFLTPVAVFALVLGLLLPKVRLLAWCVAGLALIALIGSFSRASLVGVAFGLVCAAALVLVTWQMPLARKSAIVGLVVVVLAGVYATAWVASQASPTLHDRAAGLLNPFHDESVRLRFETWKRSVRSARHHPLGQGIGAVGGASAPTVDQERTTDNSFLKVLVEQGFLGLALFGAGVLGVVVAIARRLRSVPALEARSAGLAALAGFVAFLGLAMGGETVEQPGKVAAWALVGIAAAFAFGGLSPRHRTASEEPAR